MLAQGFLPLDKYLPKLVGDILPFGRYGIRDHLVGPFDGLVHRSGPLLQSGPDLILTWAGYRSGGAWLRK